MCVYVCVCVCLCGVCDLFSISQLCMYIVCFPLLVFHCMTCSHHAYDRRVT